MQYTGGGSTTGDVQYTGGYHDKCGGRSLGKQLYLYGNPSALNDIPQCTEHRPVYCTPPVYCTDIMKGDPVIVASLEFRARLLLRLHFTVTTANQFFQSEILPFQTFAGLCVY